MVENIQDNAIALIPDFVHNYSGCDPDFYSDFYSGFMETQTLDIDIFQDLRVAIGEDLEFSDLLTIYLNSAENLIDTIQSAFVNQKASQLALAAHSLKSTSASIGAIRLSHICKYLEKFGKTGQIPTSTEILKLLSSEYNAMVIAVKVAIIEFMAE